LQAEAVAEEVFCGSNGGLRLALVLGELADEREHLRDVIRYGWADKKLRSNSGIGDL
jgi:hypothetical protein